MPHWIKAGLAALSVLIAGAAGAETDRDAYIALAKKGWSYQLRTTMVGRDMSIPVRISGRTLMGASICVVGEEPRDATRRVITQFRQLMREVYGKPVPIRYAGPTARLCGAGRTVVLRLYSGRPPARALTDDLYWLNEAYQLGLPPNRMYNVGSPAMAQTFFGRRGQGTHLMIKQPASDRVGDTEAAFYRSILIEELFQSFTFGMDILHFDRAEAFLSKLEEFPVDLRHLPWESPMFMEGLLRSNPSGLCEFDIFMMYAVARAPVTQTTEPAFISFITEDFDTLLAAARATAADPRFDEIYDADCAGPRD